MAGSFKLRRKYVGDGAPVFIVAELSANHAGRRDIALATVEAAARAGADAIKLQTYTPDTLTLASSAPPFIVKTKNVWAGRTLHDLYREAMTPWEWHAELRDAAEAAGLEFFSTPFDATAVEFLEQLGVAAHKIASFEIVDLPLVENIAARGKPLIISTGMASLGEIEAAVRVCREAGNENIVLLRCVSSYPASPESMNLASIDALRSFGTIVGLSDHTRDPVVAITATALGAKLIEKHFILDRTLGGPDSFFSLEPAEFRAMVDAVRVAESAIGRVHFGPTAEEQASVSFRRSLFVARDVRAGTVLTCDDIRSVRPADGLPARHLPEIIGRLAREDAVAGTPVSWGLVGSAPSVPQVEVRPFESADVDAANAWHDEASSTDPRFTTETVSAYTERLVATEAGVRVGEVLLHDKVGGAWELMVMVAPDQRGRGIGQALLLAAATSVRARGGRRVSARVARENARGIRMLKRAGFYGFAERTLDSTSWLTCERHLGSFP